MRGTLVLLVFTAGCARVLGFEEPVLDAGPAPIVREPCFVPNAFERVECDGGSRSRTCNADGWSSFSACATPGFRPIPPAPIRGRIGHTVVWTGDEYIVWGGRSPSEALADGAAYDPITNTWRILPEAPLGARADHAAVWTGKEMFVWGGRVDPTPATTYLADGATYDPRSNTWQRLPGSPMSARARQAAVWSTTTREVLLWGGVYEFDFYGSEGAAFEPIERRWTYLATTEAKPRVATASVWDGARMVIVGGECGAVAKTDCRDVWAHDPSTGFWEKLGSLPLTFEAERWISTATDGPRITLFGGEKGTTKIANGTTYDPATRTFTAIDAPTSALGSEAARMFATVWWADGKLWVHGGFVQSGAFDDHTATWSPSTKSWAAIENSGLGPRMSATATSSHDDTFVFGGRREGTPPEYFVHLADGVILRHQPR